MTNSNMKNMIVLKDLPSNLIEEAIIILKSNQKIKNYKYVPNQKEKEKENGKRKDNYIVKEAEMIISNYISDITEKRKPTNTKLKTKYERLKIISFILSVVCWIELVVILM